MLIDKSGRFCLATLEFAFTEQESLMTTHCPSCGLKLIIKHEFLVNRFSSLGLIIGISAIIGYHIGANKNLIKQFCRKLLRLFNLDNYQQSSSSTPSQPSTNIRKVFLKNGQSQSLQDCSNSDDSAVDIYYWSDYEDLDDANLHEFMINQNNQYYFDDYFFCLDHPNQKSNQFNPSSNYNSKTVDKIDQVLHQIDDIKKSIVEIDGELYHVTGSKYANFNPDFLTLTDFNQMEEFDENSSQFTSQKRNTNSINQSSSTTHKLRKKQRSMNNSNDLKNTLLVPSFNDNSNDDDINFRNEKQSSQLRKLSQISLDFSSQENLQQLEWDESECNFFSFYHPLDLSKNKEENNEQNHLTTETESKIMMTDEQKLQTTTNYVQMQELLEEAKRLGLLNNLIDAFLNQSSSSSIGLKSIKEKDNLSINHYNYDNNSSEDENF